MRKSPISTYRDRQFINLNSNYLSMSHGHKKPPTVPVEPDEPEEEQDDEALMRKYQPDIPINEKEEEWDDGTPDGVLKGGCVTSKEPTIQEACYADDIKEIQKKRIYPSPTYCTAEFVYETLALWDHRLQRKKKPSNLDVQDIDFINMDILAMEEYIDSVVFDSWRTRRVKDKIVQMKTYWGDGGVLNQRTHMAGYGGNYVTLNRGVLPWDPEQGDELWHRTGIGSNWENWTDRVQQGFNDKTRSLVWIDGDTGRMYINTILAGGQFRITYRYGGTEDVPYAVQRACGLLVAVNMIDADWYVTKLGQGGDLGGNVRERKESMLRTANKLLASIQRPTVARIAYG